MMARDLSDILVFLIDVLVQKRHLIGCPSARRQVQSALAAILRAEQEPLHSGITAAVIRWSRPESIGMSLQNALEQGVRLAICLLDPSERLGSLPIPQL
jgi:hypothetical protein